MSELSTSEKLTYLIARVDVSVVRKAIPELGTSFPIVSKLVAEYLIINHRVTQLIFDHSFAKALFPNVKEYACFCKGATCSCGSRQYEFEGHLQQAVMHEDPIDYLYKAVITSSNP